MEAENGGKKGGVEEAENYQQKGGKAKAAAFSDRRKSMDRVRGQFI